MRTIIAISGKQGAGKDYLADILITQCAAQGRSFTRAGLADALKVEWGRANLTDFKHESPAVIIAQVDWQKNRIPEVRRQLIDYGQEKKVGCPFYWVDRLLETTVGDIVVPDMRFLCEVERFQEQREHGDRVFLFRLECPRELRASRRTLCHENDVSETELDHYRDWTAVVHNDGRTDIVSEAAFVCRLALRPALATTAIPV